MNKIVNDIEFGSRLMASVKSNEDAEKPTVRMSSFALMWKKIRTLENLRSVTMYYYEDQSFLYDMSKKYSTYEFSYAIYNKDGNIVHTHKSATLYIDEHNPSKCSYEFTPDFLKELESFHNL